MIWEKPNHVITQGGFSAIVASWFISPALSGALAATFYLTTKFLVLKLGVTDDLAAVRRAILLMPFYLFFVFGVIWGFLFIKGIPELTKQPLSTLYPSVVLLGLGHGLIGFLTIAPWLRRTIIDRENLRWYTVPIVLCIPAGSHKYYSGTFNNWTVCDEPEADAKELKPLPEPQAVTQAGVVTIDNSMEPGQSQVQPPMGYVPVYG